MSVIADRRRVRDYTCGLALHYAELGWRVFPVNQQKRPMIKGWPDLATTDRKQIKAWWKLWWNAVGICTGPESGIWVLDIDTRKGGKETLDGFFVTKHMSGAEALTALIAKHGPLPKTLMARTPSGGLHYYFRYPKLVDIRTHWGKVGPHIDHRGRRGFVVAPDSIVEKGKYEWIEPTREPARAPRWLECLTLPLKDRQPFPAWPCWYCGLEHLRFDDPQIKSRRG